MSSRDRITVTARGGVPDRRPTLSWSCPLPEGDAVVVPQIEVASNVGERPVLADIPNPFFVNGPSLNSLLRTNPSEGAAELDKATEVTRRLIHQAMEDGADGIFYRLHGARAALSTPMEYGGFFLDRDRELLEEIQDAALNVLFMVGNDDLYYDFICDLPAHVIAWDYEASGITSDQVRALRAGAQASSDPASELLLCHSGLSVADRLDRY